ncbi:MAG: class I SAM-dependent methyltransferase [Burkholderiales bacterium]|nr:class I SAM-dependent methyltransferase [Burkholderiales bacterium]
MSAINQAERQDTDKSMLTRGTYAGGERSCPACGSRNYDPFADEHIDTAKITDFTYASRKQPEFMCLRLVLCRDCDLVYAPTPTSFEKLQSAYTEAAFDSGLEAQAASKSYAKALQPLVAGLKGRNAAVDVGAGSGPLLPWLKQAGFRPVIGIEPSHSAIQAAPPEIRAMLREGMFSPSMLAGVTSSLVCSFMTLEHLAEPGEFIALIYEKLEPGGMIAVVVHNWRAPLNRILHMRSPIIDIEHLQLFSPQSLQAILKVAGFESVIHSPITNSYPLSYWLRLTPLPKFLKSAIHSCLEITGLLDKMVSFRVGNLLAVGIKPLKETK